MVTPVTCTGNSPHYGNGCALLKHYDANRDRAISAMELMAASADLKAGSITQAEYNFVEAVWKAGGSIRAKCTGCYIPPVTCTGNSPHYGNGCALLKHYDANRDGVISAGEAMAAIGDLKAGTITQAEYNFVEVVWKAGGSINAKCTGCYTAPTPTVTCAANSPHYGNGCALLKHYDANRDGVISAGEAMTAIGDLKAGRITQAEYNFVEAVWKAGGSINAKCAGCYTAPTPTVTCAANSPHYGNGCALLKHYDANRDGVISAGEAMTAIGDLKAGRITQAEYNFVEAVWKAGGSINAKCAGCYTAPTPTVTCAANSPHYGNGCALLKHYDANRDGVISAGEAMTAIGDLKAGRITQAEYNFVEAVWKAGGSINAKCAGCYTAPTPTVTCAANSPHYGNGCALLKHYDANRDGVISAGEAMTAIGDLKAGRITQAEYNFVEAVWKAGGSINAKCAGCYTAPTPTVTCAANSPHYGNGCALLKHYDANRDGVISAGEAMTAIGDLKAGRITQAEYNFVEAVWKAGGSINAKCAGCYGPPLMCQEYAKRSPETCWDGSVIHKEVCRGNRWTSTGETCPDPAPMISRLQNQVRAMEAQAADLQRKIADLKTRYGI